MKRGIMRRNGVPLSDQATMTLHLVRHEDILTIMGIIDDPVYLEEKLVLTGSYRLNPRGNAPATNPTCFPFTELPGAISAIAKALPSGALADVLRETLAHSGVRPSTSWLILAGWALVMPALAARLFRWE